MFNFMWRKYLTLADKILIICLAVLALGSYSVWGILQPAGEQAIILVDNRPLAVFSLKQSGLYRVQGREGELVVQIKDGALRVLNAGCREQVCRHMGWIKNTGEVIICLPNHLLIRIGQGQIEKDYDAVTR
ncbi:MAG: NusG domain II-containing protein [Candidatus Schekmanbacteria bacterium]|nr:NusG domain II-containing protein [Candidatus Schekmanbacteria bacterium]